MKLNTRQFSVLLLTAFYFIPSTFADYPLRRNGSPFCAYLSKQIFCYGGYIPTASPNPFISLNLSSFTETVSTDTINSHWSNVVPIADTVAAENRYESQGVALPDGVSFMIQGGYNYDTTYLPNQTIVYNTASNTWTEWPGFIQTISGNTTTRQIYGATAVYLSSSNSVAYYGGNQQHVYPGYVYNPPENSSYQLSSITYNDPMAPNETISDVGFFYITLLNIDTKVWSSMIQTTNNKQLVYGQTATYHPRSGKIYYIGGMFIPIDSNINVWSLLPFTTAQYFDTAEGTWGDQSILSAVTPSPRMYHTANLMPSGGDIIIYGGSNLNDTAVSDYCISFNVDKMAWTSYKLTAPENFSGERFQHAAVLVNSSLFVMFGSDINGSATNDLAILDVSNPANVTFMTNYVFSAIPSDNGAGLSTGAKVGIAVGCVLAVAFIFIMLYFLFCRKGSRHQNKNNLRSAEDVRPQEETMEVDWDQINQDFYKGRLSTNLNPPYSGSTDGIRLSSNKSPTMLFPANTNTAFFATDYLDGSTAVSPSVVSDTIIPNVSGSYITPNVVSEPTSPSSPHTLHSFAVPDVEISHDENSHGLLAKPNVLYD